MGKIFFQILASSGATLNILGLMSGTSGDGIDAALLRCPPDCPPTLLWHDQEPHLPPVRRRLQTLMRGATAEQVARAARYVADLTARAVKRFRERHPQHSIHVLACHGQTLAHEPAVETWDHVPVQGTLQVLDAAFLAQETSLPVIYDFRSRDLAVGGQGAPLVPYGDLRLFGDRIAADAAILNIGGIANLTILRKNPRPFVAQAFDTGPGNMLLDALAVHHSQGRLAYDADGGIAAKGKVSEIFCREFLRDPYFSQPPPKSTGRDRFGSLRLETCLANAEKLDLSPEDLMASLLECTVRNIVHAIQTYVLPEGQLGELVIAGGGAANPVLVAALVKALPPAIRLSRSEDYGVPAPAREAMAFALLGEAFLRGKPGNIPSATGARIPVLLGSFVP